MQKEKDSKRALAKRRTLLRGLLLCTGLGTVLGIGIAAAVIGAYKYAAPALPAAETIRDIPLQIPLRVYSRDGHLISELGQRKRVLIEYNDVPEHVVHAFIAAEDRRFFVHPGIDYVGVSRAAFRYLVSGGNISGGGSTLTQQLARDYFLTREQTAVRKLKEAFLAWKIEQEFTKEQIMALFLNKMFFGQRAYGVAAAAQVYFNKPLADLDVAEAATLAGVLPAPSRYNPVRSAAAAKRRRGYVLGRMLDLDYIDEPTYEAAMAAPMESTLYGAAVELEAPYVAEMVRREMLSRYGEATYTAGYQVVTALDSRLQSAANYAIGNGLLEYTRRRGYMGPLANFELDEVLLTQPLEEWPDDIIDAMAQYAPGDLSVALVTGLAEDNSADILFIDGRTDVLPWQGIKWAAPFIDVAEKGPMPETVDEVLQVGDLIYVMPTTTEQWALTNVPDVQGALVSMDPYDGAITSLVGGFDYATSKFNRATQSIRQPGSSFKPFIYSAALAAGNTPATVVDDSPVVIRSAELERLWRPLNYTGRFYGPTRLREALVRSMNLVSVRLLLYETGVGFAARHIAKFGFGPNALPRNGSLALGAGSATPLDMAQGYATIANGGHSVKPYVIDAIYGPDGEALYRAEPVVVCEDCEASMPAERFPLERVPELTMEEMADIGTNYRPDVDTAPELYENIRPAERATTPQNAFIVQDMMRDVIQRGTGRRARVLGRRDLSGKTGTSNDFRDAWFGGFNGDLAAIVWIGYDVDQPLGPGEEGSRTALPVWIQFMQRALEGVDENQMPEPDGILNIRINRETGCPAKAGQPNSTFEKFRVGNVPDCEDLTPVPDFLGIDDAVNEDDEESESLF